MCLSVLTQLFMLILFTADTDIFGIPKPLVATYFLTYCFLFTQGSLDITITSHSNDNVFLQFNIPITLLGIMNDKEHTPH